MKAFHLGLIATMILLITAILFPIAKVLGYPVLFGGEEVTYYDHAILVMLFFSTMFTTAIKHWND